MSKFIRFSDKFSGTEGVVRNSMKRLEFVEYSRSMV
jgi:hypothetical protein